jgi:hypothetical protein
MDLKATERVRVMHSFFQLKELLSYPLLQQHVLPEHTSLALRAVLLYTAKLMPHARYYIVPYSLV